MAFALLAALALGGAGGYVAGTAAAQGQSLPAVTAGNSSQFEGPASRWSHEERATYGLAQFGPASRWSHEELPDYLK